MTRTRFILDIAFDLTVGIMMLGVAMGAIAIAVTPPAPQMLSTSTTVPSTVQETPDTDVREVTLVPVNPSTPYVTVLARTVPDSASGTASAAVPSRLPTTATISTPSIQEQSSMETADYMNVLAVGTAVLVVFNLINYSLGLVYRIGLPIPKVLK